MVTGTDVFSAARELIGTPFQHQGRKKGIGIDCAGVPIWTMKQLGLADINVSNYPRSPNGKMIVEIERHCEKTIIKPGVLVVYRISALPQHMGIISVYNDGLGLIHAWDIAKEVVEHRLPEKWNDRLIGYYALPGVNYDS